MSRNFTPDEMLIDQLLLDDTTAFEELHHRYFFPLYTYCIGKLASPADARAIVRNIFIDLWEKRHQLPVDYSISIHLYTEVRKSVVKCVADKLQKEEDLGFIKNNIIPGFQVDNLMQARTPVKPVSITSTPRKKDDIIWNQMPDWNNLVPTTPSFMRMKNLKYAFQKVLHLF